MALATTYRRQKDGKANELLLSRYIEKFYGMRSQLQKISLRLQVGKKRTAYWPSHEMLMLTGYLQTYRTNEQMMQAMKGATVALGSMNRTMNLPSLQRIAMEFERENDIMEQRQEMMDDAVDDAMDVGVEEEGDEVVEQVLEEIGVDLTQAVSCSRLWIAVLRYSAGLGLEHFYPVILLRGCSMATGWLTLNVAW